MTRHRRTDAAGKESRVLINLPEHVARERQEDARFASMTAGRGLSDAGDEDRSVKAVHADVSALIMAGVIDRTEAGIVFPYDAVHVEFTLGRALSPLEAA